MSRVSHAARLERLRRQLRDEPVVRVTFAPWVKQLAEQYRRVASGGPVASEAPRPATSTKGDR